MNKHKQGRGFITIGIGPYYRYMAKLLAITYRLNGQCSEKLAVVTDVEEKDFGDLFDIVIKENKKLKSGYLHKLRLDEYSPFEETIFLDADMFITDDITNLWDFFRNVDFGVVGINSRSRIYAKNFFNFDKINKDYGIEIVPKFNGGVYYFKDNDQAKNIFRQAEELTAKYEYYEMPGFQNVAIKQISMGDEPLIALSMAINGFPATVDQWKRTMYHVNNGKKLELDVLNRKCTFIKRDKRVYPSIIHFGTDNTKMYHYKKEAFKIKMHHYHKTPLFLLNFLVSFYTAWYFSKCLVYQIIFFYKNKKIEALPVKDPWFGFWKRIKAKMK